ncbi:PAS/PAC sensor signal transduction histidine kinase [Arcobacter nitrofigilis DSM 7299]|uniref:histidine kinase n=1 Tax=Arcobacter nitrofigilis (strain ATCC 33309 / DSM 7299 / CCUG 15893 / LMG 7604 / NCTC 12251 / CI) TaxID=572480 RepID=D5V2T0_ARCNC|nr:PAS domain-containing sensor histidine kinase [Arcobacter nitrofigilis]ADG92512.1 PAS/PAC sensor signal transduction histidine kinase [Arcobacter nitrofigilis DSM 7299]
MNFIFEEILLILGLIVISLLVFILILVYIINLNKRNKELNYWANSTIEGIALFEDGKLIKANNQVLKILGYKTFQEIYLKSYYDLTAPQEHYLIDKRIKGNYQDKYEIKLMRKDGSFTDALVKGNTIKNTNRRISIFVDISELKNTQRKLKELNLSLEEKINKEIRNNEEQESIMFQQSKFAEMGLMLHMIAHQWRQPLNNISLVVNLLIKKQKNGNLSIDTLDRFKNDFQKQINYLSNTIDDFREFFKPEKFKEKFSLLEMIQSTYSLLKPIFQRNNITFNLNIQVNVEYFGYENELSQVILNILNNSKDALIENNVLNKIVKIDAKESQNYLIINIQDNGKGVKEKNLKKLFEPYFSTKSQKTGTGLGLYMSKIIIEKHFNGNIFCKNILDGFEVTIKLPKIDNN